MADYYPLIARAVSGLDNKTGDMRRALYERAQLALVNQLRSFDPPLNESDIARELSVLEEAIQKIEAEATKRSRSGAAEKAADRPPQDEPSVAAARNSALEPSAPSKDDKHHAYALPVRSYDLLIKIVLLLLIVAGLAGAAYLQRNALASLLASYFTNSGLSILDFVIPVFAYGVIVLVFFYWLFRQWFGFRS
jgi:hypothetical protein